MGVSYNNIGLVYDKQGNDAKAQEYISKALAIFEKVLGENHKSTITCRDNLKTARYLQAFGAGKLKTFCETHCFTATAVEDNTLTKEQGMSGKYILLEFADWNQDSTTSLVDKNNEQKGKPTDILVMKDGMISQHHFDNTIGIKLGIEEVNKEEKQRIDRAYEEWKKEHRQ